MTGVFSRRSGRCLLARNRIRTLLSAPRGRALLESIESRLLFAGTGLAGTYFDDMDLTDPVSVRLDPAIDFDWAGGIRAYYGHRICGCLSLELGYLGVFDNSAAASVVMPWPEGRSNRPCGTVLR